MEASRHQFLKKATRKKLIAESADILRQIREELPPNLAEMEYFYERLQAWSEGKIAHEKPLIGTFCIQVPEELIFALDAQFERLCDGSRACDLTGMERLGGKSCSMIKASLGRLDALAEPTDYAAIIIPTTCDQKKKLGDILKAQGFPILFLNMPSGKMDDAARHFWHQSVQELATELQKILNVKLTTSKLLEQVKIIGRARQAFRDFEQLRARKRAIHGVDALIISSTWFFDTPQNWTQALLKLNAALAKQQQGLIAEPPKNSSPYTNSLCQWKTTEEEQEAREEAVSAQLGLLRARNCSKSRNACLARPIILTCSSSLLVVNLTFNIFCNSVANS
ncbi:hypothetical protein TI05_10990 [Achromatium sp. WMS3]|nr:hypothetical protein TI05_10990 [Achromatium sp. WMS3]